MFIVNKCVISKESADDMVQTDIKKLEYNKEERVLTIYQRDLCCTDKTGAIKLAKKIDPDVKVINTYSGEMRDITYFLHDETNKWESIDFKYLLRYHPELFDGLLIVKGE